MKRLNGVLAVLTNPAERANYDRALARAQPPFQLPPARRVLRPGKWRAAAAGLALLLVILPLLLRPGPPAPPPRQFEPTPANTAPPPKAPARQAVSRPSRPPVPIGLNRPAEANPESDPPAYFLSDPWPGNEPEASRARAAPDRPGEVPFPAVAPAQSARAPASPTLSGEWLYVPSVHAKNASLYPPEYIELRITENAGILRGRYRARYRITDQAISPVVSFQFAGPAEAEAASLPWIGIGGAKGEVSLRLVDHGALEVDWVATQMGQELGLISGTATLVRRVD